MKVLVANIEDVFREAAARWTLIAYFCLSSLVILMFAAAVNLDVVNGALAGAKLFGQDMQVSGSLPIAKIVTGFESIVSGPIYGLCIFLAIFATAHLVPRMQDKGTIDLYLSRPVSRLKLISSRYVAGLILASGNVAYLILSIWFIVMWKTHIVHPRFLLAGVLIIFMIAALLALAFLIGVITSSTGVSIMATYAIFVISLPMAAHERMEAAVSSEVSAWLIKAFYWVLPKSPEIGAAVVAFVAGGSAPEQLANKLTLAPFVSTAIFGLACFALAALAFKRKEF